MLDNDQKSEENEKSERAVLVSVVLDQTDEMDPDASLNELEELLKTAGGEAFCRMIQTRSAPDKATFLGKGKIAELKDICHGNEIDLVVFDCELSPSQIRNIEDCLDGVRVIDRTMLILDIFARNAKTREGILQVAIANLHYTLPRLAGSGASLSRLGGGIGTRGPGESKLELDRRHAKEKIRKLEDELAVLSQNRKTQRKSREKNGVFQISIAGYTNAGKSTLLNRLCEDKVLAEDKLFATLDPTTRRLVLPHAGECVISDTVGFINRLPHHLVEAFRSTLDEVVFSDLVLVVMDASDPRFLPKARITEKILTGLFEDRGVPPVPFLYVLNKCDRPESAFNRDALDQKEYVTAISAKSGAGVDRLLEKIEEILTAGKSRCEFFFPHGKEAKISLLYQTSSVENVRYETEGVFVTVVCDEKTKGALKQYLIAH